MGVPVPPLPLGQLLLRPLLLLRYRQIMALKGDVVIASSVIFNALESDEQPSGSVVLVAGIFR